LKLYNQAIAQDATRGLSSCQSALSTINEALQYEPGDGNALTLRRQITACVSSCNGIYAVQHGDFDQGISLFREAESEYPESNALWERSIAWAESVRQEAIDNANAKAAAERERDEADRTRKQKEQEDALWGRGKQLQKDEDFKAAEAIWHQVIALDLQNSGAYFNLGLALSEQHQYTEAEAAFRQAVQLDPKDSDAEYELGDVLDAQQRYAEAEAAYRQAVQLDPKDAASEFKLGYVLAAQHRYAEAETAFRQAIQLDPKEAAPEFQLGYALEVQKRYAEAEAAYRKALELSPDNMIFKFSLHHMIDLQAKVPQQEQASQPATPAATAGEELKDALNSGNSTGTGNAANSSPSQKALDEANSTKGATGQGLQSTTSEGTITGTREDAIAGGNKIWDTKGEKIAAPPVDLRGVGKAPALATLLSHISQDDKVKNDQVIKTSVAWYSKLESDKAETKQKIADVQKQIDSKQGDPGILKIEQSQLTNDLQNIQHNQQTAENAIKKQLVKLDMPWIEQPETPDKGAKEQQP
jgi:tetratricopeptide (TPR) repeat protein